MAVGNNHNIGVNVDYGSRGAAATLAHMQMVQRGAAQAMSRGSAQQLAQMRAWDSAIQRSMFKTGTGASASLARGLSSGQKNVHQAGNNLVSIAEKHAVRLGGAFQQLGFQAQLAGMTLMRAFTIPVAAAVTLGSVVGVKLAMRLESATTALKALLPAGYDVDALLNRLRKTAIKSPVFNTTQLVEFTRKLVASGVEIGKTELIMTSLGRVFQTFGVTGEGVDLAMRGISQAFSKGKLQAEELTGQIGEQIPALSLLARAAGVTQGEFLKMVKEGKITSGVFADLLIKIGRFPEIMKGASGSVNTMQGALDRLKESVQDALAQTFLKHSKEIQDALNELTRQIPEITEAFGPIVPKLVTGFTRILAAIVGVVKWYNQLDKANRDLVNKFLLIATAAAPLILFFGKINTLIGFMATLFRVALGPVGLLTLAFSALVGIGLIGWLAGVTDKSSRLSNVTQRLAEGWDSAASDASNLTGKNRDLEGAFGRVEHSAVKSKDGVKKFGAQLRDLWDAFTKNLIPAVGDFISKLNEEMAPAFEGIGLSIDDILPKLTEFTDKLAEWINKNGDKIAEAAGDWLKKFVDGITDAVDDNDWTRVGKEVGDALGDAIGGLGDLADIFDKWAENTDWVEVGKTFGEHAGGVMVGFLAGLGDDIFSGDFWKNHWFDAMLAGLGVTGVGKFAGAASKALLKIGKKIPWEKLFDGAKDLAKKMPWGKIMAPFRRLGSEIRKAWDDMMKNLEEVFPGVASFGRRAIEILKSGFSNIGPFFSGIWDDFVKNINDIFPRASAAFRNLFSRLGGAVRSGLETLQLRFLYLKDAVIGVFRNLGERLMSVLDFALLSPVRSLGLKFRKAVMLVIGRFFFLSWLFEAGKDLIQGLINGIVEKAKEAWESFRDNVLKPLRDGLKKFFGISSPSTVMHGFGGDIVQGLIDGMVAKWGELDDQVRNIWSLTKGVVTGSAGSMLSGVSTAWSTLVGRTRSTFDGLLGIVRSRWQAIKDNASTSAGNVLSSLTSAWSIAVGRTRSTFDGLYGIVSSRWSVIRSSTSAATGGVLSNLTNAWSIAVGRTRSTFDGLLGIIRSRWEAARGSTSSATGRVLSTLTSAWNIAIGRTRSSFDGLLGIISSRWTAIRNTISITWNNYIWPTFRSLIGVVQRTVPNAFNAGVNIIKKAWDRLRGVALSPVNFVIDTVYNRGIAKTWNNIATWLGIPNRLKTISPIFVQGRESGGLVDSAQAFGAKGNPIGRFSKPTAIVGEGKTTHPEYVIPTDPKYRSRAIGLFSELGGRLLAAGGRLDAERSMRPIPTVRRDLPPGRKGGSLNALIPDALMNPIRGALSKMLNSKLNPFDRYKSSYAKNWVKSVPKNAISWAWSLAKGGLASAGIDMLAKVANKLGLKGIASKILALFGGLGSDNSSSVSTILSIARQFYPGAMVSSGKRNSNDYHGQGLAADLIGGGRSGMIKIAAGFFNNYRGNLLELIHSAGRGYFVKNGRAVSASFYRSVIGQHFNHVHVAARKDALLGGGGLGGGGGSLGSWIRQAMQITRTPGNWYQALYNLAMHESGGNPRAQNNWDINARRGTPSKGLFQTIDPTFRSYSLSGMRNIWNPVHNAVAAIRYIKSRYGSIFRIPSYRSGNRFVGGYANGTPYVPATGLALVHKGERIIPASQNKGGSFGGIHIHFDGPVYADRREIEDIVVKAVDTAKRKNRIR